MSTNWLFPIKLSPNWAKIIFFIYGMNLIVYSLNENDFFSPQCLWISEISWVSCFESLSMQFEWKISYSNQSILLKVNVHWWTPLLIECRHIPIFTSKFHLQSDNFYAAFAVITVAIKNIMCSHFNPTTTKTATNFNVTY